MIGVGILSFLRKINLYSGRYDEDFVDRMNNMWSAYLMIIFAIIISAKQMFGDAITCWFPAEFPKPWTQYAENYCWVKNTYFIPMHEEIPSSHEKRSASELAYYQWVPFVLALQALMFYIPAMIWRLLNWQTGVNIQGLLNTAVDIIATDEAGIGHVKSMLSGAAAYGSMKSKTMKQQVVRILVCFNGNQRFGNYIISMYIFTKILYVINIICQFYLVKAFIGVNDDDNMFYAVDMMKEFAKGNDWKITGHFPRITMCDFTVRSLGQSHNYTVQCVLPVNMLNEKLYIFVFFWLLFMGALTCISLINWLVKILLRNGESFLQKYVPKEDFDSAYARQRILGDVLKHDLKRDGLFVLRLLSSNVGEVVTSRLVKRLWDDRRATIEAENPHNPDEIPLISNPTKHYPSLDEFNP